jgi:hypothetical protein
MTEELADSSPIKAPKTKHPDDRARVPLEAAIGVIPGGSAIVKLVGEFVPTQAQKSRSKWEGSISERTNEHTKRLDQHDELLTPSVTLTGVAVELAVVLCREPGDGMAGRYRDLDSLCKLLPTGDRKAVAEGAFELASHGLVYIRRAMGPMWWLKLAQRFYEQLDHQVMEWGSSTNDDARHLAKLLSADDACEWTPTLHAASGWDKRRFNPAFTVLLRLIPDGRVSGEIQPDYPAQSLSLLPEDRAVLRRFAHSSISE